MRIGLCLAVSLAPAAAALATVVVTKDSTVATAFQAGRTVLTFDEINVPPPYFMDLPANQYAALGILITANVDGSSLTNVCQIPAMGHFGITQTPPNIIGGGVTVSGLSWRETVRFDFPVPADAIGAHTDWTGSNTTLTAYAADGTVLAAGTADQGDFVGIEVPGIAYATWRWNFDQSAQGFSLDNVVFSIPGPTACPGDMNCDGVVNFADIDKFVAALSGQAAWDADPTNAGCPWLDGDCSGDGNVTFADIDPFVSRLGAVCQVAAR